MSHSWCNFYEKNHEESTCEVKKSVVVYYLFVLVYNTLD
jgi:hypothetical protein